MKSKFLLPGFFVFFLFSFLTSNAQKIDSTIYEQIVGTPGNDPNDLPINCTEIHLNGACNYLRNINFTPYTNYNPFVFQSHLTNPFGLNLVSQWDVSHGTPQITDGIMDYSVSPATWLIQPSNPPFPATGYTNLFALPTTNPTVPTISEGIVQKIPKLTPNKKYLFSFFNKFKNHQLNGSQSMDEFDIILLHCNIDGGVFNNNTFDPPTLTPGQFQSIVCQTSINHTEWQQYVTSFVATQDFDLVLIYPKKAIQTTGIPLIQFAYPELIDVSPTKFTAGPDPVVNYPNCTVTIGPPSPNCSVVGAVFTWTSPTGVNYLAPPSQQLQVDASIQSNVGNWTLTMTVPNALIPNGGCSTPIGIITDEVYVAQCCPNRPTISPSGPIDYYTPLDASAVGSAHLTSSSPNGNQWYRNGVAISGATSQTYNITNDWNGIGMKSYYVINNDCRSNTVLVNFKNYGYGYYGEEVYFFGSKIHPIQTSNYYCHNSVNNDISQIDLGVGSTYTWNFIVNPSGGLQNISLTPGSYDPNLNYAQVNIGSSTSSIGASTVVQGVGELNGKQIIMEYFLTLSHPDFINSNLVWCVNSDYYITNYGGNSYSTLPGGSGFDWEYYDFGPNGIIISGPGTGQNSWLMPGRSTPQTMIVRFTGATTVQKKFYYNWGGCYKEQFYVTTIPCIAFTSIEQSRSVIYPNPASNQITITSKEKITYIEIADPSNFISRKIIVNDSKSVNVNLSDLKPGIYNCKITSIKKIENQKIVIHR